MSCLAINSNKSRQTRLSEGSGGIGLHPCIIQHRTFCQVGEVKFISLKIEDILSGVAAVPELHFLPEGNTQTWLGWQGQPGMCC